MRTLSSIGLALLVLAGCDAATGHDRTPGPPEVADGAGTVGLNAPWTPGTPATRPAGPAVPDSEFAALVAELSEPDRYFDTDNLISNEASYLHVMGDLESSSLRGGAYLGVGPGQNFSYMTAIRPELSFIIDIRRDNALQHLWYKAVFERSASRLDFLCLLLARACAGPSEGLSVTEVVARVDRAAPVDTLEGLVAATVDRAAATGVPLSTADRSTIAAIHRRFAAAGLDLRFNTHDRSPSPFYPTLRELLLERDRTGRQASYLRDEEGYRFLARAQRENRVVPVVGDLAGERAVAGIGRELRRRGLTVATFYVSNVEFYLFRAGSFPAFIENLRALPVTERSVLIRSYFNRGNGVPETVPGYISTQLLQGLPALLEDWERGRVDDYWDLVRSGSVRRSRSVR